MRAVYHETGLDGLWRCGMRSLAAYGVEELSTRVYLKSNKSHVTIHCPVFNCIDCVVRVQLRVMQQPHTSAPIRRADKPTKTRAVHVPRSQTRTITKSTHYNDDPHSTTQHPVTAHNSHNNISAQTIHPTTRAHSSRKPHKAHPRNTILTHHHACHTTAKWTPPTAKSNSNPHQT